MRVGQLARRRAEKRERTPGLEMHAEHRLVLHGVDDEEPRIGSRHDGAREGPEALGFCRVMHAYFVLTKIDHELHRSTRENAFLAFGVRALQGPEIVDEPGKRRSRNAGPIEHRASVENTPRGGPPSGGGSSDRSAWMTSTAPPSPPARETRESMT